MKVHWTKEAFSKLLEIEEFIALDNPIIAIDFTDELISLSETLIDNPLKGRIVPELTIENIRELLYKNYRIVYIIKKHSIDILTVFERHRKLRDNEINI